jgi:hypothetical protein
MLGKILDYETIAPPGAWRSSVLVVSDRGKGYDPFEALQWEALSELGLTYLAGTAYSSTHLRYWTDFCLEDPDTCDAATDDMHAAIEDVVNDGVSIVQYVGHGNFDVWSDDNFFCTNDALGYCPLDQTQLLANGLKLPWLMVHTCLSAGFHTTNLKTFGEQWMKHPNGGAMAVFGPSGLGFGFLGEDVIDIVWGDVFGQTKHRELAIPVMDSLVQLCTQGSVEGCQFYTLQGDPSTTLGLPHVGPVALEATPSTGTTAEVSLSWTASTTPGVTYSLYRKKFLNQPCAPGQPYCKIADLAGTEYLDTDVNFNKFFYYYVVAVADGFESAWSNFNETCTGPGEPENPGADCVQARPLNLVPPATPTGVQAIDAETGGRLDVTWNANPEPDIFTYTVRYGTDMSLENSIVVFGTSVSLTGLANNVEHFIAVEAKNTSGTLSDLSEAAVGTPHLIQGIKPPQFVGDLRLAKSGADAVLTWGVVTTNVYGQPAAISHYEVYRGTEPDFLPAPGNRIGEPVLPTYTDNGALLPGGPDYHYLVRAVDAAGLGGGLGRQIPSGIADLRLDKLPTHLLLQWNPVTLDLSGDPADISHYTVYASDEPFTREDIENGSVPVLAPSVAGTAVLVPYPLDPRVYYSVLAVDVRGNESPF